MPVTVTPEKFALVNFDAHDIATIASTVATQIGFDDIELRIEVDETTPLTRALLVSIDPVVISAESGALEDPKRIRYLSPTRTAETVGRLLLRARDRRPGGGFEDAPGETALSLAQSAAWDVYANGRLERLGQRPHKPRWQYHFRNRHGFTDVADASFERIWGADQLTFVELEAICSEALSVRPVS